MGTANLDELFARTLEDEFEDDRPWQAVTALRFSGTREIFERAAVWCTSPDPLKRARGADIIGQIGKTVEHPKNAFPAESLTLMSRMAETEEATLPLVSSVAALGHLDDPIAIPSIVRHYAHADSRVRFAVACALGHFPDHRAAIEVLLTLTADTDADVRDWATFGVGVQGSADSSQIRDALLLRLADQDKDTRGEGILALAKRKDRRVLPALLDALRTSSGRAVEAASFMLDAQDERSQEDWTTEQYVAALKERFP